MPHPVPFKCVSPPPHLCPPPSLSPHPASDGPPLPPPCEFTSTCLSLTTCPFTLSGLLSAIPRSPLTALPPLPPPIFSVSAGSPFTHCSPPLPSRSLVKHPPGYSLLVVHHHLSIPQYSPASYLYVLPRPPSPPHSQPAVRDPFLFRVLHRDGFIHA